MNTSAQELFLAFADYKKHPCLINHSTLMECLENFASHFDSPEDFIEADIVNS